MCYQKWIGRLLFSVIAGWIGIAMQALAGPLQTCTFHDTGMVNLPAQITVPTNTPLGAVIATGEADINFTCTGDLYFAFAKLARCGDFNSQSFDCGSVSIENMGNNTALQDPAFSNYSKYKVFYSPYMGVGMRLKVKYVESNAKTVSAQPEARYPEVPLTAASTFQREGASTPAWWPTRGPAAVRATKPANAGNVYWKGKLVVELIKIENRWSSQQAFDNYSLVSYQEFAENRPQRTGLGLINGKNGRAVGLGYSGWDTHANLNRDEFLSHAMYISFVGYDNSDSGINPFTSRVYRLNTRIVEPITCTVTTPVVNVDMGNVSANELDRGTTPERTFNVGINCPGGARVAMAFTDNSEPSNTSNTLTISKNSEAAGIGLQLRKDSTPITYNSSNSNMILVAELANAGFVNVPLVAKVVKTGPVRVGRFTAQSTITLGYQ